MLRFEPPGNFRNNYDPPVNKLRTKTSQAQFRYKETSKAEIKDSQAEKKPQPKDNFFPFESEMSAIQKNNDTTSLEKEINNTKLFFKEERPAPVPVNEMLVEIEPKRKTEKEEQKRREDHCEKTPEENLEKRNEIFFRTMRSESKTMGPAQIGMPKIRKELLKTKSIANRKK